MRRQLLSLAFLITTYLCSASLQAQKWQEMMHDPSANFYQTQAEFNQYWSTHTIEKGKGYKPFRRWEYYMEPRVYPKGDITLPSRAYEEFLQYQQSNPQLFQNPLSSTWTPLGPSGAPTGGGAGRINFVRFHPTTSTTLFAGAPDGGLWKSTNSGTSWATTTDQLAVIGCTDIAIDPTNTQIMYLATGDGDAGDSYSIGILKSTDGGATWNTTGLNWAVSLGRTISRLLMDPTNSSILLAATSNGIYRTTDAGVSWTQVRTGSYKDMEFKPGDNNTIYAAGNTFWKSTNNGVAWTQVTSGVPAATGVDRIAIAVTPANTAYVYLLVANNTNSGLVGVYRSTDSGTNFTQRTGTSPNLLGWSNTGSDSGGQGWYDLAIAVSPTNADYVIVGGVNIWRSTNGGTNWSIHAHWTGSGAPYVHADIHDLIFLPGSGTTYFTGCDGGVFRTTNSGTAWGDISSNLQIAQQYRVGLSTSNANLLLTGHQDNGTNRYNGTWAQVYGGDGMACFIDRTNNNTMYASYVNGDYKRSVNGGGSWTNIITGLTGNAAWVAPWQQDPSVTNTLYAGYTNMFRSTNQGTSWTQIGTLSASNTNTVVEFDVAPSNNQVIYVVKYNAVYKTTNGGTNWTDITGTLPVGSVSLTWVEVCPTDANKAWVACSGYQSGMKIYQTTNGGTSWTAYSTGLPNLPANCIVYQNGTSDGLYVGMDVGVYYRDNTMTGWVPYFTGLPNVSIRDLEIYYATGKLRAATFGRSTWEVDLYSPGAVAPVANFTANQQTVCPGQTVTFTDASYYSPTSWSWSFPGGTPTTSTAQNPTVTYNTPGTYNVTLTVSNANGTNTVTQTAYITVVSVQSLPLTEGFQNTTFPPANWSLLDRNGNGVNWVRNTSVGGFGLSSACSFFDNWTSNEGGSKDEMRTPPINFTGYSNAYLKFDVAYAPYSTTNSDTLAILVSTNCGATFTQLYIKGGTTLATNGGANVTANIFVPTSAQWRKDSVNLAPYVGQPSVMIAFQNRGRYGQPIYLDNINLQGVSGPPPVSSFTASATSVCVGQPVNFTDNSTNTPTGWNWTFSGGTPGSATTQNVNGVTWATAGTYTVTLTATNGNGSNTSTQTITVNAAPTASVSGTNTICNGQSTVLTATGGGTYAWNTGATTAAITVAPTTTTTYTVTVTNAAGCTATSTRTVTVNNNPTASITGTNTICNGQSTVLTASGGGTYAWNTGATTAGITVAPTATTTYTVTVTNAAGCTATSTRTVTVNNLPTVNISGVAAVCNGQPTTLTASGGGTYLWNTGATTAAITVSPAVPTTYTVTVTNAAGCTATGTQTVNVSANPTASVSGTNTICSGQSTTLTATGGGTYSWNTGATTSAITVSPTTTTTYTVTVTNAAGCTATSTRTVTVNTSPTAPVITPSGPTALCSGGSVTLTSSYGSGNNWSTGSTNAAITVTTAGTYTVTYTSANGCTASSSQVVTVGTTPSAPVITPNGPTTFCQGGSVNLSSSYSNGNSWSTGNTNGSITVSSTGTYSVTYTDMNGCTSSASTSVTVNPLPAAPVISANGPTTFCQGGSVNLSSSYASGNNWNTGSTNGSITVTTSGTYTVTYTDGNGCSASASQAVTVNNNPTVTLSSFPIYCESDAAFTLNGGSPAGGSYSGTGVSSNQFTPSAAGQGTFPITYTYTDGNGCQGTAVENITVSPCLGVENTDNSSVIIYPNPTNGVLQVSGLEEQIAYVVYNTLGQRLQSGLLSNGGFIDITACAAGVYYLEIGNTTWKVVKR